MSELTSCIYAGHYDLKCANCTDEKLAAFEQRVKELEHRLDFTGRVRDSFASEREKLQADLDAARKLLERANDGLECVDLGLYDRIRAFIASSGEKDQKQIECYACAGKGWSWVEDDSKASRAFKSECSVCACTGKLPPAPKAEETKP